METKSLNNCFVQIELKNQCKINNKAAEIEQKSNSFTALDIQTGISSF